ncbi:MAG: hypothetical protein AVDCRST_MAG14-44 [uncultured Rubrobacteraceae bacterium]|uniref:Uncharacterized protein n=1 Tax=uncultured Rubrobacteraceae bacterium TaxID=349277 RepID=A0A6J4QDU4_9ACTN|nr:MAG: hypothetical protein AVDCRST_MAG14-44 [uncultured Rubrobacteraceae bacterium]
MPGRPGRGGVWTTFWRVGEARIGELVVESGHIGVGWTREARGDYSASLFSGYERQMRRHSAGEYLSGLAFIRLLPHLQP